MGEPLRRQKKPPLRTDGAAEAFFVARVGLSAPSPAFVLRTLAGGSAAIPLASAPSARNTKRSIINEILS